MPLRLAALPAFPYALAIAAALIGLGLSAERGVRLLCTF